jgi:uncharacterized tellurite resistance protein B-like protein
MFIIFTGILFRLISLNDLCGGKMKLLRNPIARWRQSDALPSWLVYGAGLFTVLLFATDLFARAGGGGNYSGSGGGGGGGGGGDLTGLILYLLVVHPEIGVPVVIVVIVGSIIKRRLNPDRTTARAVKRLEDIGRPSTSELDSIKSRDPRFDEARFLEQVTLTDQAVQRAWTKGDMSPVRLFLSDGLFRRFFSQLSIMKHQGIQNAMADHTILKTRIHAVECDAHFDTIHVAIEASVRDVEVSAALSVEEAAAKAAKAPKEPYTEIWSFLRRPGAKTLKGGGAVEGTCPNCGAEVRLGQATKCEYCNALINSGDYDWVLAEITQPIEWRASSTGAVPGLEQLAVLDPNFNRQAAEDRGSYLFWRWIESLVTANAKPLAKCATKSLYTETAKHVETGPSALFKTAVGSVDLIACEADGEGQRDRVHIKVLWSSARSSREDPAPSVNVLTLSRKTGAHDPGGLSYARCPVCQAPLEENDRVTCDYCDANLASGNADWVLERVRRPEELVVPAARPITVTSGATAPSQSDDDALPVWTTPDMGNPRERTLLLMRMAAVVMADGVVTKQERKLLRSASKRWNVPIDSINPILYGHMEPDIVNTMKPSNPEGFLSGLISAALIDGRIDKKEATLLLDVGDNLGIAETDVKNMMRDMTKMAKAEKGV